MLAMKIKKKRELKKLKSEFTVGAEDENDKKANKAKK